MNQNFVGGTSSALIGLNRQIAGPSLYGASSKQIGTAPASGSAIGSPDAFYSANGTTSAASTNLGIQSSSLTNPDWQHLGFTIQLQDLSNLVVSPTLGGTDAVWLVRSEVPDANGAAHTYLAATESDTAPSLFDGQTSSINSMYGKFLIHPPAHRIQGTYTPRGTIILIVPVAVSIAEVGGIRMLCCIL